MFTKETGERKKSTHGSHSEIQNHDVRSNGKQNKQMQTRWNGFWVRAMYDAMWKPKEDERAKRHREIERIVYGKANTEGVPYVLEQLRHNDNVELHERTTGTRLIDYDARPDPLDAPKRDLVPTYGAWNIPGIQDCVNFLEAVGPVLTPALCHAMAGVFEHTVAYDHGKKRGNSKTLLCTIWKNLELSHYELYSSYKKLVEQRGKDTNGQCGYTVSASTASRLTKTGDSVSLFGRGYEGTMCVSVLKK